MHFTVPTTPYSGFEPHLIALIEDTLTAAQDLGALAVLRSFTSNEGSIEIGSSDWILQVSAKDLVAQTLLTKLRNRIDNIAIRNHDSANTRRREVERNGRSQASSADDQGRGLK